jgi:hypothetical protein
VATMSDQASKGASSFQPGDRVQCTATSQKYTIHAEPHGEDVLVRSERAGGLYWMAVERLELRKPCERCGGDGIVWTRRAWSERENRAAMTSLPCPDCSSTPKREDYGHPA